MSSNNFLEKVKELRKITGVGFKDCKSAIDETRGDLEKSIDLLRKKGIAKANKRIQRIAAEGLVCIQEKNNEFSMIEINSETDFVAKNDEFINFCEEVSKVSLNKFGNMEDILNSKMANNKYTKDNLVDLISKIGEKITLRRCAFIKKDNTINFSYMHSSIKKNIGKLGVLLSLETPKNNSEILNFGKQLYLIKKDLTKENTLLNQEWIMEPKKKVKDIIKNVAGKDKIKIKKIVRYKVGEAI